MYLIRSGISLAGHKMLDEYTKTIIYTNNWILKVFFKKTNT